MHAEGSNDLVLSHIDEEIDWYTSKKIRNRRRYRSLKALQIVAAAVVPVLTSTQGSQLRLSWVIGGLGVSIVVAEGFQQLGQFYEHWIRFALAAEALKREKRLYLSRAGHYATADNPQTLLAEKLEEVLQEETSTWVASLQRAKEGSDSR